MAETYTLGGDEMDDARRAMPGLAPIAKLIEEFRRSCPKFDPSEPLVAVWRESLSGATADELQAVFRCWHENYTGTPQLKQVKECLGEVRKGEADSPEEMAERAAFGRKLRVVMARKPKINRGGIEYEPYVTDADIAAAKREPDPSPEPWAEEADAEEVRTWAHGVAERLSGRFQA